MQLLLNFKVISINYYHYVNTQFSLCCNVFNKVPTYLPTDLTLTYVHDEHLDLVEELRERQNEMKETFRVITNAAVNIDLSRIIENNLLLEADIAKMLTMLDNLEEKLVVRC